MFAALGNLLSGSAQKPTGISGKLYKADHELVYEECQLSVAKHVLVIQAGDAQIKLLITKSLQFHRPTADQLSFSSATIKYHFSANADSLDAVEMKVLESLYEQKTGDAPETASMADLEALKYKPLKKEKKTQVRTVTANAKQKDGEMQWENKSLDLYLYEADSCQFVLQAAQVTAKLFKHAQFEYTLQVSHQDQMFI